MAPKPVPPQEFWMLSQQQLPESPRLARLADMVPHIRKTNRHFEDQDRETTRGNFQELVDGLLRQPSLINSTNGFFRSQLRQQQSAGSEDIEIVGDNKSVGAFLKQHENFLVNFLLRRCKKLAKSSIEKVDVYDREEGLVQLALMETKLPKGLVLASDLEIPVLNLTFDRLGDLHGKLLSELRFGTEVLPNGQVDFSLAGPYSYSFSDVTAELSEVTYKINNDKITVESHIHVTSEHIFKQGWSVDKACFQRGGHIQRVADLFTATKSGPMRNPKQDIMVTAKTFRKLYDECRVEFKKTISSLHASPSKTEPFNEAAKTEKKRLMVEQARNALAKRQKEMSSRRQMKVMHTGAASTAASAADSGASGDER